MFLKLLTLATAVMVSCGCASTNSGPQKKKMLVTVDTIGVQTISPVGAVYIENKNENITPLEKEYFNSMMKAYVESQGMKVVAKETESTVILLYSYYSKAGVKNISRPIMQYTPPQSYSFSGYGPGGYSSGFVQQSGFGQVNVVGQENEEIEVNHNLVSMMAFHTAGYIAEYLKKKPDLGKAAIWQVQLSSTTLTNDFKKMFPFMLDGFGESFYEPGTGMVKKWIYVD